MKSIAKAKQYLKTHTKAVAEDDDLQDLFDLNISDQKITPRDEQPEKESTAKLLKKVTYKEDFSPQD